MQSLVCWIGEDEKTTCTFRDMMKNGNYRNISLDRAGWGLIIVNAIAEERMNTDTPHKKQEEKKQSGGEKVEQQWRGHVRSMDDLSCRATPCGKG